MQFKKLFLEKSQMNKIPRHQSMLLPGLPDLPNISNIFLNLMPSSSSNLNLLGMTTNGRGRSFSVFNNKGVGGDTWSKLTNRGAISPLGGNLQTGWSALPNAGAELQPPPNLILPPPDTGPAKGPPSPPDWEEINSENENIKENFSETETSEGIFITY